MKKIDIVKCVKEHKKEILYGALIIAGITLVIVVNNSDFMKGARELMQAAEEGRLQTDF